MPGKITKRNLDYFDKKYPLDKVFANPSTAPPSILHVWLLLKEVLETLKGIESHLCCRCNEETSKKN